MTFKRKYGVLLVAGQTAIYVPMIKRGVVDFAVGADWTTVDGDITVKVGTGSAANITNRPTAVTMGNTAMWQFILTAAELQAKTIEVTVADSATKAVEDQMFIVETYGHASAMYKADLSGSPTTCAVISGTRTATSFPTDLTETTNDHWKDAWFRFTSGALNGQVKQITGYNGSTKTLTFSSGFTAGPSIADTGEVVNY